MKINIGANKINGTDKTSGTDGTTGTREITR